jgi:hypothetical protein
MTKAMIGIITALLAGSGAAGFIVINIFIGSANNISQSGTSSSSENRSSTNTLDETGLGMIEAVNLNKKH